MIIETLVTVTRDGVQLYQDIATQIEFVGDMEMHVSGGVSPFYRYEGFIWKIIDMRQNDYLKDQLNTDPITGIAVEYQVIGKPGRFPDGHMEFKADDRRVTGFS